MCSKFRPALGKGWLTGQFRKHLKVRGLTSTSQSALLEVAEAAADLAVNLKTKFR